MQIKKTMLALAVTAITSVATAQTDPEPTAPTQTQVERAPVSLSSELFFGFAGSTLTPDSKMLLDRIIPRLKVLDIDVVLATGHADRIGNESINEKLSVSRARAVRDYLIQNGIPADKIKVDGRGSTEPVTSPEECKGKKGLTLQECYAPDRRVNLTAQGYTRSGEMALPDGKTETTTGLKLDTQMKFVVFFRKDSVVLTSADNDLLDEIADAAMEADKVILRGKTAQPGSSERKKQIAISRAWAVRQALVFRGVDGNGMRVFYNTRGLNPNENNERVDVEVLPKTGAKR